MKNKKNVWHNALLVLGLLLVLSNSCKKDEKVPVLTTSTITNITGTSSTCGGTITSEGSGTVLLRGVCWSTGTNPTIADSKTSDGAGAGTFTSNITGLNGATVYYVRAYATNDVGTGYGIGIAMSFTTLGQVPTPTNSAVTNITTTSATLNGVVNANYLSTIVTFEYGTTTGYGNTVTATQSPVTGNTNTNVSANITGLTAGTVYHYRVKGVNSLGTSDGSDLTFTTLGQVPTLTTTAASNITTIAAQLNGTVNANYLSTVVTFEYGTTTGYGSTVTATQSPMTGNTNTNVSANITGLTAGTIYHYRVKGVNSLGTSDGSDLTFSTIGNAPTVTTKTASSISTTSVILNGSANANYFESSITFEYGSSTSYGSTIIAAQSPITGNTDSIVSASITGLSVGTTYHYRVVATNALGTTLGNDMIFSTFNPLVDIEGNNYNIITIGNQIWMAENLKTTKYNDGISIPIALDRITWESNLTPQFCWYEFNELGYKNTYGALYNWLTVETNKLCPIGWHVPTDTEWTTLTTYLWGSSVAGSKMRESGTVHWTSPNLGATNESGFTALPGGSINGGSFYPIGSYAYFWSSSAYNLMNDAAWCRSLNYYTSSLERSYYNKLSGFSIRCLKD